MIASSIAARNCRGWRTAVVLALLDRVANQLTGLSQAKSALFGSFVGTGWLFWGAALAGKKMPVWMAAVAAFSLVLLTWSIVRFQRFRRALSPAPPGTLSFDWRFRLVVFLEFVLIGSSSLILYHLRRPDLVPLSVTALVGIHFLPLARILPMPSLYPLGLALVALPAVALLIPDPAFRGAFTCLATGACMGSRAIVVLSRHPLNSSHA